MIKKKIKTLVLVALAMIVIVPYVFVEINTLMYGEEFAHEYKQTNMIVQVKYHKVFSISENKAKVCYISEDSTDYVYFEKEHDNWKMISWETVWSRHGSASDMPFPFYR